MRFGCLKFVLLRVFLFLILILIPNNSEGINILINRNQSMVMLSFGICRFAT